MLMSTDTREKIVKEISELVDLGHFAEALEIGRTYGIIIPFGKKK